MHVCVHCILSHLTCIHLIVPVFAYVHRNHCLTYMNVRMYMYIVLCMHCTYTCMCVRQSPCGKDCAKTAVVKKKTRISLITAASSGRGAIQWFWNNCATRLYLLTATLTAQDHLEVLITTVDVIVYTTPQQYKFRGRFNASILQSMVATRSNCWATY